ALTASTGASITEDELFSYTNGRYLVNEEQQRRKRYVKFDIQALCRTVSALTKDGAPVSKIDKMEGGFSKALLVTTGDGREVVAKIRTLCAGREKLATASEAAVLQYLREHTTVPIPKLLAWNDDPSNSVGAEYIIMEKAPGTQLYKVWDVMKEYDRIQLVVNLVKIEKQLSAIKFPAYGCLYFRHSIAKESERILLDASLDPTASFCIGPECGPAWTDGSSPDDIEPGLAAGPWHDLVQLVIGKAQRSNARSRLPIANNTIPFVHGSAAQHTSALEAAIKLAPSLVKHDHFQKLSDSVLWHTDLHLGNIYVSAEDPTQITCVIDWQHTLVSPVFTQARWPVFLQPPGGYSTGMEIPKLPEDFEELDPDDKELARVQKLEAVSSKAYELQNSFNNRLVYCAIWQFDARLREVFRRVGDTWDEGIVRLREALIAIHQQWEVMGFLTQCPITVTAEEVAAHAQQFDKCSQWVEVQDLAKKLLCTDGYGWIMPGVDFAWKQDQNKRLLELAIRHFEAQLSEDEMRAIWPFPP
ncbi:MAG: hypothetical protein L6R35_006859, partial [Caloplaca aegaea]